MLSSVTYNYRVVFFSQVNTKASDNIREERERLSSALADRSAQFEEIKSAHDALNKKLKAKDKRVRDLEDERLKVTEELAVKVSFLHQLLPTLLLLLEYFLIQGLILKIRNAKMIFQIFCCEKCEVFVCFLYNYLGYFHSQNKTFLA